MPSRFCRAWTGNSATTVDGTEISCCRRLVFALGRMVEGSLYDNGAAWHWPAIRHSGLVVDEAGCILSRCLRSSTTTTRDDTHPGIVVCIVTHWTACFPLHRCKHRELQALRRELLEMACVLPCTMLAQQPVLQQGYVPHHLVCGLPQPVFYASIPQLGVVSFVAASTGNSPSSSSTVQEAAATEAQHKRLSSDSSSSSSAWFTY